MLLHLRIENYALIKSLEIPFDKGFTVITGETGAGKSILLGALSLILGSRVDTSHLHDKTRKCFVEGEFAIRDLNLESFFTDNNLDYQDISILRREINESGKSRAFINDTPVTLTILKELAVKLVDIHSQHQNLLLNNAGFRISIVDLFGKTQDLLHDYYLNYRHFKDIERKWALLNEEQQKLIEEKSFLEFLDDELSSFQPVEGEQEEKELQLNILSNTTFIKEKLSLASMLLSEGDKNIISQIKEVKKACEELAPYKEEVREYSQRLESSLIEIQDIAYGISRMENDTEVLPAQQDEIQHRLDRLYDLEHKHNVNSIFGLLEKWEIIKSKLQLLTLNNDLLDELHKEKESLYTTLADKSAKLSDIRIKASKELEKAIMEKLKLLGIEKACFQIKVSKKPQPGENGVDDIAFYFSANQGAQPEEIANVASGGELSRLMLAIKSIITDNSMLPTVIFDEIDTGISGEIASKVAGMMNDLSKGHQLLAITHLPQIAAKGKLHYYVYKEVDDKKTYTNIKKLNIEERIEEIAKMMSGEKVTEAARNASKELLELAK